MDVSREEQKREIFKSILFELAKSQVILDKPYVRVNMYKKLEELYWDSECEQQFRHFYSDIFVVLTDIKRDGSLGSIDVLGQNIAILRSGYQPQNKDNNENLIDISDSINKLYDHVNLDIARLIYFDGEARNISGEKQIEEIGTKVNDITQSIKDAQTETTEKISNQQKEYIAILGIFAAVVLAFTGGISFSASVLNSLAHVSVYRLIIMTLIVGLVLVNILHALFYYTNKIVNKEERLRPLAISNLVMVALILITVLSWWFGVVEKRNNINANVAKQDVSVTVPSKLN